MRIIAGSLRGRSLVAPKGLDTRPTSARVRESLFQHLTSAWLGGSFDGLRVLDLYAGSGALGIEALSRGAAEVTFVEKHPKALAALERNLTSLGVEDSTRAIRSPVERYLSRSSGTRFDLVFADPPYAIVDGESLQHGVSPLLAEGGILCIEHSSRTQVVAQEGFAHGSTRQYGDTTITIVRRVVEIG